MSQFNTYGSGNPVGIAQPAATVENYLDTANYTQWYSAGAGFQPETGMIAKANVLNTTAAQNSLLVLTAPVNGLFQVFTFAAQATSTGGTLPNFTVTYTDLDTGAVVTAQAIVTGAVTNGQGHSQSAVATINAQAGTTITVASQAPATLTANVKARIASLG